MTNEELAELSRELPTGKYGPWSRTDHLLAAVLDRLGALHAAVYRAQGAKVDYPDPWPRPGIKAERRRHLTPQAAEYLQRLRDEHASLHGSEEHPPPEV